MSIPAHLLVPGQRGDALPDRECAEQRDGVGGVGDQRGRGGQGLSAVGIEEDVRPLRVVTLTIIGPGIAIGPRRSGAAHIVLYADRVYDLPVSNGQVKRYDELVLAVVDHGSHALLEA